MKSTYIDLQPLRSSILTFLDENRDVVGVYSEDSAAKISIDKLRQHAARTPKGSQERTEYTSCVRDTVDILLNSLVYVAIRAIFKSVPSTYNSLFNEVITGMTLPSSTSLYNVWLDQDDNDIAREVVEEESGIVTIDDAMVLFDDLYVEAISYLSCYQFEQHQTVEFEINADTLTLKTGDDYRIAVFNTIFKDGWNGPLFDANGKIPEDNLTQQDRAYIEKLREVASEG